MYPALVLVLRWYHLVSPFPRRERLIPIPAHPRGKLVGPWSTRKMQINMQRSRHGTMVNVRLGLDRRSALANQYCRSSGAVPNQSYNT